MKLTPYWIKLSAEVFFRNPMCCVLPWGGGVSFAFKNQKKELLFQQFLYCVFPIFGLYVALEDYAVFVSHNESGHLAQSESRDEGRKQCLLVADNGGMDGVVLQIALAVRAGGIERNEEEVYVLAVGLLQVVKVAQLLACVAHPRCPQHDDEGLSFKLCVGERVAREANFLKGGHFLPYGAEQLGREAHEHSAKEFVCGVCHGKRVEQGLCFGIKGMLCLHKVFAEDGYGSLCGGIVVDKLLCGEALFAFALSVGGKSELGEQFVLLRALNYRFRKIGSVCHELNILTRLGNEEHFGKVGVKQGKHLGLRQRALVRESATTHTDGVYIGVCAPFGVDVEVYLLYVLYGAL